VTKRTWWLAAAAATLVVGVAAGVGWHETTTAGPAAWARDGTAAAAGPTARPDGCAIPRTYQGIPGPGYAANDRIARAVAAKAEAWARTHAAASFAGGFVDVGDDHGYYMVAFARDAQRWLGRLRQAVPHPERVRLFAATHPLRELSALQARVDRDRGALAGRGVRVTTTGVDVACNVVEVGISKASAPGSAELVERRYGAEQVRVTVLDPVARRPGRTG
jgi:hypothetical protein